jgi:hypothetical protein
MMIARTRQCAPAWRDLKDVKDKDGKSQTHPLRVLSRANEGQGAGKMTSFFASKDKNKKRNEKNKNSADILKADGSQLCSVLENDSPMTVKRNSRGYLTCPADGNEDGSAETVECPTPKWYEVGSACDKMKVRKKSGERQNECAREVDCLNDDVLHVSQNAFARSALSLTRSAPSQRRSTTGAASCSSV